MGKALGLALAGGGLVALAPAAAFAAEDAPLQERLKKLEAEVEALKREAPRTPAGEADRPKAEDRASLWIDRHGKPLGKVIDAAWITANLRMRPTWSTNTMDFEDSVDDEGFTTLFRGGLGVGARLRSDVSVFIGLDFNGTWGNTSTVFVNDTTTTPYVQEAWIDGLYAKQLGRGWETRLGRFFLEYGDEYVLGNTEFAQTSTTFDGVRLSHNVERRKFRYDVFATKLVDGTKNPLTPTPDDSVYMAGVYGNWYGFESLSRLPGGMEPYYIWIHDGREVPGNPANPSAKDVHTGGFRWYGEKATKDRAGLGWNVNWNAQYFDDLFWSTDSRVTYTLTQAKWKPKVFGQFAHASGDKDGGGGTIQDGFGYVPLWQDSHGRFGWADQFVFSNIQVYGVGVHATPREAWTVGAEVRAIDAVRETAGNGSKRLAYEGDLILKHKVSDNIDVECVFSHVAFRERQNAGGSPADKVQRAYVQVVVAF
jgi:hypothetical protein